MSYARAKGWQTKPKPGCMIDPTHPLSRGLVGCWLFNEGAGSRLTDISGYGNHGVLTNMNPESDWVGSPHGGALDFDGSNDFINVGNNLIFDFDYSMSLLVLFKSNLSNYNAAIISKWTTGGIGKFLFYIGQDTNNNKMSFVLMQGDGTLRSLVSNHTYSAMESIHVAATADGSIMKLYKNSIVDSITTSYSGGIKSFNFNLLFGKLRIDDDIYSFNGILDGVWLYKISLNEDLIKWHYNNPYANILSSVYRRYFIPVTVGGISAKAMYQYRQRRLFV